MQTPTLRASATPISVITPCTRRILSPLILTVALSLFPQSSWAQNRFEENAKHFEYDSTTPLNVRELSVRSENGVLIHDLTYASPRGGSVSAYLVVPKIQGKLAAILWGHWMMPKSPLDNREEFLAEAIAIAPAGVMSLMIDDPQARSGFHEISESLTFAQQVVDLRRGIDLLLSRPDVDPNRIAYVGHSYDSEAGAVLDAVDKRLTAVVLMGGPQWSKDSAPDSGAWDDPASYVTHLGPASAFFQCGLHDEWDPVVDAKEYFRRSTGPKQIKFYDSGHALNAEARRDRFIFLREHLRLRELPPGAFDKVPQTH